MPTLRELIDDGRVHVFDGAMGTMLYAEGVFINVCYDELSLRAAGAGRGGARRLRRRPAPSSSRPTPSAPTRSSSRSTASPRETEAINARRRAARARGGGPVSRSSAPSARSACASSRSARLAVAEARGRFRAPGATACSRAASTASPRDLPRRRASSRRRSARCARARDLAGHRADDHRRRRPHRVTAPTPETFGPRARGGSAPTSSASTARSGPQGVLEAIERLARVVTRAAVGAAQRRPAARRRRSQDVHGEPRVHGRAMRRRIVEAGARFVGGCCGTTPGAHQGACAASSASSAAMRARARGRRRHGAGRAGAA